MNRRGLLAACGAALGSGFAGCLGGGNPTDGTETTTTTATDTTTTQPTNGTTDPVSAIRETSFTVTNIAPENQDEAAAISVDGQTVTVTGTIMGRNGCYTARLDDARIEDETLVVAVESYEDRDDDEACTDAIVYIDYEATIELDTEPPADVRVTHNGDAIQPD